MSSAASFIRNADTFLQVFRQRNLHHLNDQYGHGFQSMLVQLMKQVDKFISPTEVSNLVNASKNPDGSIRSVFHESTARSIEQALDLPMCCLDVPDWHFRNNLDYFWQYAARAADHREWFDGLLHRLLNVPAHPAASATTEKADDGGSPIDWGAIRARLQQKQETHTD